MNQIAHNRPAGGPVTALARQVAVTIEARQDNFRHDIGNQRVGFQICPPTLSET